MIRFLIQTVASAFSQLQSNKLRAFLTSLGIIVGVASVTSIVGAMTGLKQFVLSEFETIGTRYVYLDGQVPPSMRDKVSWRKAQLTMEEIEAIMQQADAVELISPVWAERFRIENGEESIDNVRVQGIWPEWNDIESREIISGRPFTHTDNEHKQHVCIINERAIEELDLDKDPLGDFIFVDGRRFLIVGIIETKEFNLFGMGDAQTEVYIPFETARKMAPHRWIRHASARLVSEDVADDAKAQIRFILRKMRGLTPDDEDTFIVEVLQGYIDQFKGMASALTAIAGGIVAISLLVGGIGIMNIMLVSVSERTREIGLRKAVGARPAVILTQFLVEAVVLCLFGGYLGVAIGQGAVVALNAFSPLDGAQVPMWAIVLAFVFSAGVGVIFGMFPAIKASRLDPIEALRHE